MPTATDISAAFVYGVSIKIPELPCWETLCQRLEKTEAIPSLFATASRAASKEDIKDTPEPIAKSARSVRSVWLPLRENDGSSEEEDEEEQKILEFTDKLASTSKSAMDQVLGKGHGLRMVPYAAEGDSFNESPSLLLQHEVSGHTNIDISAGTVVFGVGALGDTKNVDVDENIRTVLERLGLEADSSIGWQFVATVSEYY